MSQVSARKCCGKKGIESFLVTAECVIPRLFSWLLPKVTRLTSKFEVVGSKVYTLTTTLEERNGITSEEAHQ
jgi:hypothetical protein